MWSNTEKAESSDHLLHIKEEEPKQPMDRDNRKLPRCKESRTGNTKPKQALPNKDMNSSNLV